ncbi:MAG: hypothetical protein RI936_1526, partial [Pseudomonadota bacterium]
MDFSLILLILTLATGALWLLDRFRLAPARRAAADAALKEFDARNAAALGRAEPLVLKERHALEERTTRQPAW